LSANTHSARSALLAFVVAPLLSGTLGCSADIQGQAGGSGSTGSGAGHQGGSAGSAGSSGKGGTSGTSGSAGTPANPDSREVDMRGEPLYSRFLRLTVDQWENSVHDVLRLSAPTGVSQDFQHAVGGTTDFDNNERVVYVDNQAWRDFQAGAEAVALQVTATNAALQAVVAGNDAATFIKTFGRRAFRRELNADEVTAYTNVYTTGTTNAEGTVNAHTKGARYVIMAMLQSPNFLYRMELGDRGAPLSGYEMAAKLSLWIRDTTPTDAMLDAAENGSFDSAAGAAMQATQMLGDPAVARTIRKFNAELHKFALYDSIQKTGVSGWSDALNPEMKEASYLFFDRIFSQGLGVADMLTSTVGFAGPGLAKLYDINLKGSGIQQVDLGRAGYYAQAPFLTLWARNIDPDSIHRGVRINLDTLCAFPGVPNQMLPDIPAPKLNQTNRQVITDLTSGCGKECHGQIINPIGFAFENFDGLGRARSMDNGSPVDTSGSYPFAEGFEDFADSTALMQIIATGSQAHQCWAKKMAGYALERDLVEAERPLVVALGAVSQQGASLKDVMVELVKQDAFRTHVGGAE
jgi:uncharacterized protein DUF1592/uncharacterized protein DUF1595/uncharacterized protein DUF1588/uncharacterized protein DUF1585/uncharacterized protein DUF1587